MNDYLEFLEKKKHSVINFGIEPIFYPDGMFDYQKHVTEYAIKKGRCAVFLDTGLGKTVIELTIAKNYLISTNKRVLIITPLAVAFQFIKEAEKFGIDDISYSKDGKLTTSIVVCNYERLDKFDYKDFDCVILDESSILKNFDGAIKQDVTNFLRKVKYRFLFTATPSPNDFIELGTSSEALGYMGYMEMLKTFFANNENNIRPQEIGCKWYLKPHAKEGFFKWVSSWSISMRKPSDFGFSDDKHILPKLILNENKVQNNSNWNVNGQLLMFNQMARTMTEVKHEQQQTIKERCEKAFELASKWDKSVYWCNFNYEGDMLQELDKNAYQIKGGMDLDKKEDLLLGFLNGDIQKLITKPKMTAFGLNWQHCNHTVYFPTWSYEQFYQSIRRFWRFGQKREVTVDLVFSDGQKRVIDTLKLKTKKADELFQLLNTSVNAKYDLKKSDFTKEIIFPNFL
jgi:hypothetical protein